MLVLRRNERESICIGEGIVVTVLAVEKDRVKLGITAPPEVRVLRQELTEPRLITQVEQLEHPKRYH